MGTGTPIARLNGSYGVAAFGALTPLARPALTAASTAASAREITGDTSRTDRAWETGGGS